MKLVLTYVVMVAALAGLVSYANPDGLNSVHGDNALVLFGLPGFICLYFLPSYIAVRRGHTNAAAIVIANIFLGWTFVSWVWCLISAFATLPPVQVQVVHQGRVDHYPHRVDDWGRTINYHD